MDRTVLLVDGDLLALGRLEAAAQACGTAVHTCSVDALGSTVAATKPDLVVVDLDRAGRAALDELERLRTEDLAARVVAFVSHVDDELIRAARAAGIDAWPRGRFWNALDEILNG